MNDSKLLHFLRSFPAWIVLAALTVFFVMLYYKTGDTAYKEWAGISLASTFTALGVQRITPPSANTNSGDINVTATEATGILPTEKKEEKL